MLARFTLTNVHCWRDNACLFTRDETFRISAGLHISYACCSTYGDAWVLLTEWGGHMKNPWSQRHLLSFVVPFILELYDDIVAVMLVWNHTFNALTTYLCGSFYSRDCTLVIIEIVRENSLIYWSWVGGGGLVKIYTKKQSRRTTPRTCVEIVKGERWNRHLLMKWQRWWRNQIYTGSEFKRFTCRRLNMPDMNGWCCFRLAEPRHVGSEMLLMTLNETINPLDIDYHGEGKSRKNMNRYQKFDFASVVSRMI